MKKFSEYLSEDFDPAIFNADGAIAITDPSVLDAINSNLEVATSCGYRTPYNALEEIRKILAYYKIFLPKSVFLDQNHGNDFFEVSQFGDKMGMNNQGEVVTANDSPLFIYFEWSLNEKGMYDTFASIVDQDELDEILADCDSEVESDDTVNEEAMPNLKKKMGANKVTLSNMMRKEETLDEVTPELAQRASDAAQNKSRKLSRKYMRHSNRTNKDKKFRSDIAKQEMKAIKQHIKFSGYAAKKSMKEETLNELHGKSKVDKEKLKAHIRKKHDDAWGKTKRKREKNKSSGPADTRDEDNHRNRLAKMYNKLGEEKRTFDSEKAFKEVPAKETKTPETSPYRAARKLARKAKENAEAKKK